MMFSRSCPKCGSGFVTQTYCSGCPCSHQGYGRSSGHEHMRMHCSGCGYGWNERTLDDVRGRGEGEPGGSGRRRRGLIMEGDEHAPKLPTMHRKVTWSVEQPMRPPPPRKFDRGPRCCV
jgi:hypothetical protein